jgi:hypothetical protein
MYGFKRSIYQVLPESGARVNCVEINDHGFCTYDWFMQSIKDWPLLTDLKVYLDKGSWDTWVSVDWDFVLVVPHSSVRSYWSANDGMQAWRHRRSGHTIPDHCRQTGGCPEVWNSADVKGKRELEIANLAQIEEYVVLDHNQTRFVSAFPERSNL